MAVKGPSKIPRHTMMEFDRKLYIIKLKTEGFPQPEEVGDPDNKFDELDDGDDSGVQEEQVNREADKGKGTHQRKEDKSAKGTEIGSGGN